MRPQRPSLGGEDDAERGALFLRADRLEGLADRQVSAEGRVELRTHRETVLADRIAYDLVRDEVHATGNVVLRKGSDWIIGPEVVYHRPTQSGVFDSPTFQIGDSGARGDASKIVFAGADRYDTSVQLPGIVAFPRLDVVMDDMPDVSTDVSTEAATTTALRARTVKRVPFARVRGCTKRPVTPTARLPSNSTFCVCAPVTT